MTPSQIEARINRINEQILDLQDITFEENIPKEERSSIFYQGTRWHSDEEVQAAKKRISELQRELEKLEEQETLIRVGARF